LAICQYGANAAIRGTSPESGIAQKVSPKTFPPVVQEWTVKISTKPARDGSPCNPVFPLAQTVDFGIDV
jgi:hypothetical protein